MEEGTGTMTMCFLHCISALDVGNGHFGFWAPFSYLGGLYYAYGGVGVNGEAVEGNRR